MKKLILLLVAAAITVSIFLGPKLFKSGTRTDVYNENPTYQYIDNNISQLEDFSSKWTPAVKVGYDSINNYIEAAEVNELIDSEMARKLDRYLNSVYIPIVVEGAKDFFANNCNPPEYLNAINRELKNYSDYSRDQTHKSFS